MAADVIKGTGDLARPVKIGKVWVLVDLLETRGKFHIQISAAKNLLNHAPRRRGDPLRKRLTRRPTAE